MIKDLLHNNFRLISKRLEFFWYKFNKIFKKIKLVSTNSLLSFALVTNVLATNAPQTNTDIITGDSDSVKQILESVDNYTNLINEKNSLIFQEQTQFIEKPILNKTVTQVELKKKNSRAVIARDQIRNNTADTNASRQFNGYLYGFCTWYVANIRTDIPNSWGNAKNWFKNAQRDNFETGQEPKVGAIMVTSESWAGHVAYVESVNNDSIAVSEMNKIGWNRQSSRVIPKNSSIIIGYIY